MDSRSWDYARSRRRVLWLAVLAAAALVLGPVVGPTTLVQPTAAEVAPGSPNMVLVMMDDMRADDLPWLPVVEHDIFERGVAYSRFYAPTSLCCPSRASVLRGQYPHNTGILSNTEPAGGFAGSQRMDGQTLATWLDPTYQTGYVGKYFNGYEGDAERYIPPGWNDWQGSLHTYHFLRALTNDNGVAVSDPGRYNSDVFGDQAVDFVAESAPSDEPYFLHLSMVAPHNGLPRTDGDGGVRTPYVPEPWQGTYSGPQYVQAPSFDEANVRDKTGPVRDLAPLTSGELSTLTMQTAQRRESLSASNAAIERVLQAVDNSGEADSTYVAFMSDNGNVLGEHRFSIGKNLPYEAASRLPFAIRGPGLPAGTTYDDLAGTMDVAPTMLDLAGVQADIELDGHTVLPGAPQTSPQSERAVLLMASAGVVDPENGGAVEYAPQVPVDETAWKYRGIVTGEWKLIRWVQQDAWELYDLHRDPDEMKNLSEQPRWDEMQAQLTERLDLLWNCQGRACDG